MATFISSFTSGEIEINYKEPYLTGSLNEKFAGVVPAGTYRGFNLTTHASALTVTVAEDTDKNDHLAQYETADGYAIRIRRTTGDFSLDLSSVTSKTVVIAIYADYTLSQTTEAEIRAYELLPTDEFTIAPEKDELVVLGTVEVPASGVISDLAITARNRTPAWSAIAKEAREPVQIIKNGDFRLADSASYVAGETRWPWWDQGVSVSQATLEVTETGSPAVGDKHLHINVPSLGSPNVYVPHTGVYPVLPNSKVRVAFQIKGVGVPAGAIRMGVRLTVYGDGYGDVQDTWDADDLTLSGTWAYTEIERTFPLYSNARFVGIAVYYRDTSISAGDLYFDDIRVWVEQPTGFEGNIQGLAGMVNGSTITTTLDIPKENFLAGDLDYFISTMLSLYYASGDTWNLRRRPAGSDSFLLRLVNGDITVDNDAIVSALLTALNATVQDLLTVGSTKLDTDLEAQDPRIVAGFRDGAAGTCYTLLWELQNSDAARVNLRLYATSRDSSNYETFVITVNAVFDSSTDLWGRDIATGNSRRWDFGQGGFVQYFRDHGETDTWADSAWADDTVFESFQGGITAHKIFSAEASSYLNARTYLGNNLVGSAADKSVGRLLMSSILGAGAYYRFFDAGNTVGIYCVDSNSLGSGGAYSIVCEAEFDGTSWDRYGTGSDSSRIDFKRTGISGYHRVSGDSAPWVDTAWETSGGNAWFDLAMINGPATGYTNLTLEDGKILLGQGALTQTNPGATVNITPNTLYAKNIVKAWATISITGTAGSRTVAIEEGFGIDSVSIDTFGSGFLIIDLDEPMEDHYVITFMNSWRSLSSQPISWIVWDNFYNASGICELYALDGGSAGWSTIDLDAVSYSVEVCLMFIGEQA